VAVGRLPCQRRDKKEQDKQTQNKAASQGGHLRSSRLGERMNELSRGQYFRTAPRRERASTSTMKADRGAVSPLSRREARAARGCGSSLFLLLALPDPHRLRPPPPYTAAPPPLAASERGVPGTGAYRARAGDQGDRQRGR